MTEETMTAPAATTEAPAAPNTTALFTGAEAAPVAEVKTQPIIRGRVDKFGVAMGTGRRKTSVARIRLKSGTGKITINGRELQEFFPTVQNQHTVLAPLQVTQTEGKVDVWVRVEGGGTTGQAGAIMLGIARALVVMSTENHPALSEKGYLTRDGRMVERKKYGYRKARRSFQFSKR